MQIIFVRSLTLASLLLLASISCFAQKTSCATLPQYTNPNETDGPVIKVRGVQGHASDLSGFPVKLVCVAIFTEKDHRPVAQIETDIDGNFKFGDIPNGDYRLVAITADSSFCPINVRIKKTSGRKRIPVDLNFRTTGLETCSFASRGNP